MGNFIFLKINIISEHDSNQFRFNDISLWLTRYIFEELGTEDFLTTYESLCSMFINKDLWVVIIEIYSVI